MKTHSNINDKITTNLKWYVLVVVIVAHNKYTKTDVKGNEKVKEKKVNNYKMTRNNLKNKEKDKNKKWGGCGEDCETRFGSD